MEMIQIVRTVNAVSMIFLIISLLTGAMSFLLTEDDRDTIMDKAALSSILCALVFAATTAVGVGMAQ